MPNHQDQKKPKQFLNMDRLREGLVENYPNARFLLTLHTVEDGKIQHSFLTQDFPTGDLMPCVKYLEDEFVRTLKQGASGNGRK